MPLGFQGNGLSRLLMFLIQKGVCDNSNVSVPLGEFWHIQRFNTVNCMKPDERTRVDQYLACVPFFISKDGGFHWTRKSVEVILKLACFKHVPQFICCSAVVEGENICIRIIRAQIGGQSNPRIIQEFSSILVFTRVFILPRIIFPKHGKSNPGVWVFVQSIIGKVPNCFIRLSACFDEFNRTTDHDQHINLTSIQVSLDVLTMAVVLP